MKKRTIEDIKADLHDSKMNIEDIRKYGNAVISEWDLRNGYDADYLLAPDSFLFCQIASLEGELKEATKHGEQLTLGI